MPDGLGEEAGNRGGGQCRSEQPWRHAGGRGVSRALWSRRASTASTRASILSVLATSGARPFAFTGSAMATSGAQALEGVVDEARSGHRLDARADLLAVAQDAIG